MNSKSFARAASVSGSVLLGGANVLAGTPDPDFSFADLSKLSAVTLSITKPF
jgi:hypothetical protein